MRTKLLLLIIIFTIGCSDRNIYDSKKNDFCTIERIFHLNIENKEGVLIYIKEKDKYAIKYYPKLPTIDEVHFYILCQKPTNISENDIIRFSCKLFKFNSDEGYNPTVGGTELFFATNLNIIKL